MIVSNAEFIIYCPHTWRQRTVVLYCYAKVQESNLSLHVHVTGLITNGQYWLVIGHGDRLIHLRTLLERLSEEDCWELEASVGYTLGWRPTWIIEWKPFKNKTKIKRESKTKQFSRTQPWAIHGHVTWEYSLWYIDPLSITFLSGQCMAPIVILWLPQWHRKQHSQDERLLNGMS